MLEFLRSWILNIVIIIIFIVFIEMIIPSDKFKKYVKLVTGLVLMIMIINPVVMLVNEGYSLDKLTIQSFNNFDNGQIQADTKRVQEIQNSQILSVFKENLKKEIKSQILAIDGVEDAKVDIAINEDFTSKEFGKLISIDAKIVQTNAQNSSSVQKVDINISKEEQPKDDLILKVKVKLKELYYIDKDKINVSAQDKKG